MRSPDEQPQLNRDQERFIERLAAHYTPAPMTPAQHAAFDRALWRRLQRRSHTWMLVPAVATLAVAAVVAWRVMSGGLAFFPHEVRNPGSVVGQAGRPTAWEYELLYAPEATETADDDNGLILPNDYLAIAQVFLDRQ